MRVKMGITALLTDRDVLGRLLRAGVVVVGLAAGFLVLTLLTAGKADAAERSPDSGPGKGSGPGLLGTVTDSVVGGVIEPVTPVVHDVAEAVAPVVRTVATAAEPVVTPVVQGVAKVAGPVVQPVAAVVKPVLQPVAAAVRPVVQPVLATVSDVAEPVTRTVVEPLLSPRVKAPVPEVGVPAAVITTPPAVQSEQDIWVPSAVAVEARKTADRRNTVTEAVPSRQASSHTVSDVPGPDVPWSPPTGPALTGATGGAAMANHGPGVDGSTAVGGVVLPRRGGEWLAPPGTFLGPSWWISYGRSHPS